MKFITSLNPRNIEKCRDVVSNWLLYLSEVVAVQTAEEVIELKPYFPGTILLKDFSIFNRWGNRVFTTSQRGFGWDGKVNGEFQPAGVYVWSFQAFDEKTQKSVIRKGVVTLIR